jgi:predicted dehydrogenase
MVAIGILGTGRIAERAMLSPAVSVPDVQVVAVGSRSVERARSYAEEHGLGSWGDYEDLLSDPLVDVVYVTLPPTLHADWAIRALEAGKHLLCEKPLAGNEDQAQAMVDAARRSDRRLIEAFHYLHHPFAQRVLDLIASGRLGTIKRVESTFHIPKAVVKVDDPQVDLGMSFELAFPAGVVAEVACSFLGERDAAEVVTRAQGAHGVLEVTSLPVPQWGGTLTVSTADGQVAEESADPTPSYVYQLRHLVGVVRDGLPSSTEGADGVANMRVVDDVYRAAGLHPR